MAARADVITDRSLRAGLVFFGTAIVLIAGTQRSWDFPLPVTYPIPVVSAVPHTRTVALHVGDAAKIDTLFDKMGYRLDRVSAGAPVPRVLVSTVPGDLRTASSIDVKTRVFRKVVLPIILTVNETIAHDRARLIALKAKQQRGEKLAASENAWLWSLFRQYKVKPGDYAELIRRVDIVPPSLALAQAIEESGWGTSMYARKGNALFGQEAHLASKTGLPGKSGARAFKIKTFPTLLETTTAYARNLNTNPAYAGLRALRADARAKGKVPSGPVLAGGLIRYSERGAAYIRGIRTIIANYKLTALDEARLGTPGKVVLVRKPVVQSAAARLAK